MRHFDIGNGTFFHADCFDVLLQIPDGWVDMILCDLPYGTTQNKWDSVLPLDPLWAQYLRICKGAIVLTASQPFTSALVTSNLAAFKYAWVWSKSAATGHLNAKRMPMKVHEDIAVFNASTYNPQGLTVFNKTVRRGNNGTNFGASGKENFQEYTNYPRSILEVAHEGKGFHPTQKPVALFEYLIRTYTNEGAVVLDNCAGSGTTAIAAENANRRWLCIEKDDIYAVKAMDRIYAHTVERAAKVAAE